MTTYGRKYGGMGGDGGIGRCRCVCTVRYSTSKRKEGGGAVGTVGTAGTAGTVDTVCTYGTEKSVYQPTIRFTTPLTQVALPAALSLLVFCHRTLCHGHWMFEH